MIEPLRLSFVVACGSEHAFAAWTAKASSWWPPEHTVSGEKGLAIVFEPRPGGRIFERTPGGTEIDWGEITVWDPPRRLCYLWHIRVDRHQATDVEIQFTDVDHSSTRVDIEHRGWERLGGAGPRWRKTNRNGWDGVLPAYAAACSAVRAG